MQAGLYVHVPFCLSKCPYCDFHSYQDKFSCVNGYIDAVSKEIDYYKKNFSIKFDSVFLGGGTPTVLAQENLEKLLITVNVLIGRSEIKEYTVEANPETVTKEKAELIAKYANRVSIGAQSFKPKMLSELGRVHGAEKIHEAIAHFRAAGIKNINLDMMFGIQGQNTADMLSDLKECVSLEPQHISLYMLTIYEGTPYHKRYENTHPADDTLMESMNKRAIEFLESAGYPRYEISNFAKPGFECLHNINYWSRGEYIGIGSSASSFFQGKRYTNAEKPEDYIELINSGKDPAVFTEDIDKEKAVNEEIMLSLRMTRGLDTEKLKAKYGFDIYKKFGHKIESNIRRGLMTNNPPNLSLTSEGMIISNTVISELF